MKVRATEKGYFGSMIREPGDEFVISDEIMEDERRRPSWVEPVKVKVAADADHDEADDKPKDKPKGKPGRKKVAEVGTKADAETEDEDEDDPKPKGNGVVEVLGVAPDWEAPAPKPLDD